MDKFKLFNFRPIVFTVSFLVIGILLTYFALRFSVYFLYIGIGIVAILTLLLLFLFKGKYFKHACFALAFVVLGSSISTLNLFYVLKDKDNFSEQVVVEGEIYSLEYPSYAHGKALALLKNVKANGDKLSCSVLVEFDNQTLGADEADFIAFSCNLNAIDKNSYSRYLPSRIGFTCSNVHIYSHAEGAKNFFQNFRSKIKDVVFAGLGKVAPFGYALLTGCSDYMAESEITNLRYSGVAHVFAVSGLHIGFIITILSFLLELVKIKRIKKIVVVFVVGLLYSGVCGFTASSLRALIMGITLLTCNAYGKKYDRLSSVFLSMGIILIINPFDLLSVGFILSYASVIGITIYQPMFSRALHFFPAPLADALAIVLSVSFFSTPLSCYFFDYYPIASTILNLLIVPVCSILFCILFVFSMICCVFSKLAFIMVIPRFLASMISSFMGFFSFEQLIFNTDFNIYFLVIYYLLAMPSAEIINCRKQIKLASVIVSTAYFLIITI